MGVIVFVEISGVDGFVDFDGLFEECELKFLVSF